MIFTPWLARSTCRSSLRFRPSLEELEHRLAPAMFTVSNISDAVGSGSGSLRQAIIDSNTTGGSNIIQFTGAGTSGIIQLGSALPALMASVDIQAPGRAMSRSTGTWRLNSPFSWSMLA